MKQRLLVAFAATSCILLYLRPLGAQTPPFKQCPAVGGAASCQALIVISNSGVSVLTDANAPAFGDGEDALIGVLNNSTGPVSSLTLQGSGLFGFDGDGLCDTTPTPAGCPFGPTHYEGPGVSFSSADGNTGTVTFTPALARGASTYFTLEGTPNIISAPPIITSLSPSSAKSGQGAFTLTITGSNFAAGATVIWTSTRYGPTTLTPASVTLTQIVVTVPAGEVILADTAQITVSSGGQTSNSVSFPVLGLIITTSQLPPGVLGKPYPANTSLQAASGTPPYVWGWGAGTPPGLSLDTNTGAITGTPTATGTYQFDVSVTDAANKIAPGQFTIVVTPPTTTFGPAGTTTNPTGSFAEPVHTATGNYYSAQTDLALRGRGLKFAFNRYYNSLDSYNGPLGFGWSHTYNISLTVDPNTNVVTVKEATGGTLIFNRVATGYIPGTPGCFDSLLKKTDGSFLLTRKNQTKLAFSASGGLAVVTDRNGNDQVLLRGAAGDLTNIIYGNGSTVYLGYDSSHRIVSMTDPSNRVVRYAYDANGNLATVTDTAGGITRYFYDSAHRLLSAKDPRGITYLQNTLDASGRVAAQTNGNGAITQFAYNSPAAGTTTITDANGNTIKHVYDAALRLVQTIDGAGDTTTFTYDANNNRTSITDPNGIVTTFGYDGAGNMLGMKDAAGRNLALIIYNGFNQPLYITDTAGHVVQLTYDGAGNLATRQDSASTAFYSYDPYGELTSYGVAGGTCVSGCTPISAIQYSWDSSGNLVQITDGAGRFHTFTYDSIGRLLTNADGRGVTTTYTYDNLDRLVSVKDQLGSITSLTRDAMGAVTKVTDANGNITSYSYDGVHNLVAMTDAMGQQTRYSYDGNNNLIAYTNARGKTSSYTYDAANRPITSVDPLGRQVSRAYDPAGNVLSITDGNQARTQFTYDVLNRLVGILYSDGSTVSQSYDADSNRVSVTDRHGTTSYSHDALNRIVKVSRFDGSSVSYGYDAAGRRTSVTYPDGRTAGYQYDRASNLTQVTDWNNQTSTYAYDQAGKLISAAMPNQLMSQYSYDLSNRLTGVVTTTGPVPGNYTTLSSFSYTLDKVGNRLSATQIGGGTVAYTYDALYRLTSAKNPAGEVIQYSYDAAGNRVKVATPSESLVYTYDDADEMLTGGGSAYTYDGNGSVVSKFSPSGTTTYSWDAANRLVSVGGSGSTVQYDYDADGNRVSQRAGAGTYTYVPDVLRPAPVVLNEQGPDGAIDYFYGRTLIDVNSGSGTQYTGLDGIGSVVNVVNGAGGLRADYVYDAWGNLLTPLDPVGNQEKYKWTGEAFDSSTGLYYLRARYYDPSIGRFLSRDAVEGAALSPWDRNRYAYARNNPILFHDPTGLSAEPIFPPWEGDVTADPPPCRDKLGICGAGISLGGTAYGGAEVMAGGPPFAATGGIGVGNFRLGPQGDTSGGFVQGGAYSGDSSVVPPEGGPSVSAGAGASIGPSVFFTNATNVQSLSGAFSTHVVTIGGLEFQYSRSGSIWYVQIGGGLGLGYAHLTTNTPCTTAPGGC